MENINIEAAPDPQTTGSKDAKGSWKSFLIDVLETLVLSVVLFLIINAISARIRIESISMLPTHYEGDFVVVNKLAYKFGAPSRGDVIVFRYPPDPQSEPYIKRIIGLPGETIKIEHGQVFVNDVEIREPYLKASPRYQGTWIVPQDALFVLGDNRNNSSDSHSWGMVPLENVIGKAEVVYLPISHWQVLTPNFAAAATP